MKETNVALRYQRQCIENTRFLSPSACRLAPRPRVRLDRPQSTQSGHRNRRRRRGQPRHWIGLVIIITLARTWPTRGHAIGAAGDRAADLGGWFPVLRVVGVVVGRSRLRDKALPHA